jgi:hypothetical protein
MSTANCTLEPNSNFGDLTPYWRPNSIFYLWDQLSYSLNTKYWTKLFLCIKSVPADNLKDL